MSSKPCCRIPGNTKEISDARLPASRCVTNDRFSLSTIHQTNSRIAAEIVHATAYYLNHVLAEGLAVRARDSLGEQPIFPNFGHDLFSHSGWLAETTDMTALERPPELARLDLRTCSPKAPIESWDPLSSSQSKAIV